MYICVHKLLERKCSRNTHGFVHYVDKALQERVVLIDTIISFTLGKPVLLDHEYVIGRINGDFHTPMNPLMYRRRIGNPLFDQNLNDRNNDFTSKVIPDSTERPAKLIKDNGFPLPPIRPTRNTGNNKLSSLADPSEKVLELKFKIEELRILLNRYY